MKVQVDMNKGRVKALTSYTRKAVGMTAEQLRTEVIMANVIPLDEGTLQNVQTFIDTKALDKGEVQIVHDTPYAARLYHHPEYDFDQSLNAHARGEWWEPWLTGNKKKRASELFRKFYDMLTGVSR